ncbi:MAG: hypothetical protein HC852_17250 [Acaryochloridaceae cyanobacterium RU_4_10]|nr:hypothetical protein [Acaryochloridaceae cyanobacterium RU_4_10]
MGDRRYIFLKNDRPTRDEVFANAIATLSERMRSSYFSSAELGDRMGMKVKHRPQGML